MAPRLRHHLASLLKGFVRRRRRAASATIITCSASTPVGKTAANGDEGSASGDMNQNRPPSPAKSSSSTTTHSSRKRQEQRRLSFLGLGLVFLDRSAVAVDATTDKADLRLGVTLVAETPDNERQRLLLQEEIALPMERCIADCLAVGTCGGGCGDGPMSEVTVRSCQSPEWQLAMAAVKISDRRKKMRCLK
ncbi:hypothetical protein BOX15_Mlig005562g1 [Macrostomum lignano]|uniref:Uncharacterized protein n=1 Tax=Macrostomum lignano TaxID=282301 RepID=A0A267DGP2_9PLAT|nr:hypothetical protein BOX15_Mlig005562g1 [Macrostomum lignano]